MHSRDKKTAFYFQADANTLGGSLQAPEPKVIPSQASVSLPNAGGIATARTEAFNLDEIISVAAASARASGRKGHTGPVLASVSVTSVIEGLNILEVVTARRIVAQIAVEYLEDGRRRISLAGSHIEGLRVGGHEVRPTPNPNLLQLQGGNGDPPDSWLEYFQRIGCEQADKLLAGAGKGDKDAGGWLSDRYRWMSSEAETRSPDWALCSLVEGFESDLPRQRLPGKPLGHIVEIPDFGRIFFAELLVSPRSISLSMIRAELGCNVQGDAGVGTVIISGTTIPPGKPH
jgi:hypothetical protein